MTQQVLDSVSEAEAEMAAVATACLVKALDHSNAEQVNVIIELDDGQVETPVLKLPPRALRFFADILRQMARREPMILIPQRAELTTQEAASFLNVSRPFVIKEIEASRLKCRLVNRHRRIEFAELVRYQVEQKKLSADALNEIGKLSTEIGQDL